MKSGGWNEKCDRTKNAERKMQNEKCDRTKNAVEI